MTQAIAARRDGDAFQARMFWLKASNLLDEHGAIVRVGFERGPKGFDDFWVEYERGKFKPNQHGKLISVERYQCKWHVGLGQYTHADLVDPAFINASATSFLQRAHNALKVARQSEVRTTFRLLTNWRPDPADALHGLIRSRSHTLKVDELFLGKTARSATGLLRQTWRDHLQITDLDLRELAQALGFSHVSESLDDLRERLDFACRAAGMKRIPPSDSSVFYDDIIFQWASQGRDVFDRKSFREACGQEGLLESKQARCTVFGVKSFEHAFDNLEDRCSKVLNLVPEFDERFIRDNAAWQTSLVPQLKSFLSDAAKTGERLRLALDAHTTLAFAAGSILDTKSGRTVEIEQRTPSRTTWAPDDRELSREWPTWDVTNLATGDHGDELAVAVGITHDIQLKARQFVDFQLPSVGAFLVFKPTSGSSQSAIACGAHASMLAEDLVARIKALRESRGARSHMHLFIAGPNGFSFYLGRHLLTLKPLTLYEFDFEGGRGGSYAASLTIP